MVYFAFLFQVALIETIHVVGMSIFAFRVLPLLDDSILGLALMCACATIPSLLKILNRPSRERLAPIQIVLDIVAFLAQLSALVAIPVVKGLEDGSNDLVWAIPVSLVMMSVVWWENFIDKDSKLGPLTGILVRFKNQVHCGRTKIYLGVSFWKMIVAFLMFIAMGSLEFEVDQLFDFSTSNCTGTEVSGADVGRELDWVWVWLVTVGAAIVAYFCVRTAAKIRMQFVGMALPLFLSTPLVS